MYSSKLCNFCNSPLSPAKKRPDIKYCKVNNCNWDYSIELDDIGSFVVFKVNNYLWRVSVSETHVSENYTSVLLDTDSPIVWEIPQARYINQNNWQEELDRIKKLNTYR